MVSHVSHEAGVLGVFPAADDARVLAPVQLEVLHVGDELLDDLPVLLLVLEPQVGHVVAVSLEHLAAEVTREPCAERLPAPVRLGRAGVRVTPPSLLLRPISLQQLLLEFIFEHENVPGITN